MTTTDKVQRWVDLLAGLLRFRQGISFEQLAREVPGYAHDASDAREVARVKRTFERDKDELRAFGVPIEWPKEGEQSEAPYRLARGQFYLPYLELLGSEGRVVPRKVEKYGYRSLPSLAFEPDELAAIGAAADRVRRLGDPVLAADADSAMRKLAFDLPVGALAAPEGERVLARDRGTSREFELISDALLDRKVITFDYRAMERDETGTRTVEPYGLVFASCAWYLVGLDRDRQGIRRFRVSRIRDVRRNAKKPNTADFEVPAGFSLGDHGARPPWELGDGDELVVEVEWGVSAPDTTCKAETSALGEPVHGRPEHRRFRVRRPDAFVRWMLSFAGNVRPVAPAKIVEAFRRQAESTRALYAGDQT